MSNSYNDIHNLTGKILLSTPAISNEYINKSMVYICSHDDNGAMGVVVNKLIPNMSIREILERLNISSNGIENVETFFGGIEEINRCFILHSTDYMSNESTLISNNIALTINSDIVRALTSPGGPQKKLLCIGCCLWDSYQLENEVASTAWIPIDADEALIFGDPKTDKWSKALLKIGFQTNLFLDIHGNA
ncbi:MAG: YqgE/AlgH family protein [Holosporaceae bacterium]|jgi:putative transcriptional regulator|nr:YqgE/AlgH family protein [Holosporaceae bacterium]